MRDEDIRDGFDTLLHSIREAVPPELTAIRRRLRRRRVRLAAGATAAAVATGLAGALAAHAVTASPPGGVAAAVPHASSSAPASTSASDTSTTPTRGPDGWQYTATHVFTGPVTALRVTGMAGSITVIGTSQSAVSVTEAVNYAQIEPRMARDLSGGTLTLSYSCADSEGCGVAYTVRVPAGTSVVVSEQTGSIDLNGLTGPLTAATGTGAIDAVGLGGEWVNLDTGTGAITAGFAAPPDDLQVGSGTGSVSIGVPGDVSYNVSVTGSQARAVSVHESAASPYRIRASGGTGTISIVPGAPATSPAGS